MQAKPYLVVSDIHLGAVPAATERAFRGFLGFAAETASGLLINGDLFDFWFEYRTVILREHFRVVARLAEVVESGLPVRFIGGNHDAWAGDFLASDVGIEMLQGPVELEIEGRRTLVAHGDGVGAGDLGYRALRRVIRNRVTVAAFRALHPDVGGRMAKLASSTDEKIETETAETNPRAQVIRRWAEERLLARPDLDLVVAGHAHEAVVAEVAPARFYANPGDWLHGWSYLELPPAGAPPVLRRWEDPPSTS
ncbi:MAG: UDP-2,3-diacylglucosamine diphosphatase [Gemmatimonadota bacterium]|nr:UDP-2,3-diacylglucosamine diphosphatase [Gemmatimonadota bacterium]